MTYETISGGQLAVGDIVKVWWRPGQDQITALVNYQGTFEGQPGWEGVKIAKFALLKGGMTVFQDDRFDRLERREE